MYVMSWSLTLGCAWVRAAVALVAGLLAVVAEALGRGADLGVVADIATLVARATGEGRHSVLAFLKLCDAVVSDCDRVEAVAGGERVEG